MFFHVSFHKFTPVDANTGNMYYTCKGYCNCCNHFGLQQLLCLIIITITNYTISGMLIMIVIIPKNVIDYNRL